MNRFYVDKGQIQGGWAVITGGDVRHINQVLRLSAGDRIVVCDGDSNDYIGVIKESTKDSIRVKLGKMEISTAEAENRLVLYQAVAKGTKMDYVIQKGTELGISAFVPVTTSRTVVKPGGQENVRKKIQRWQRIAMEAAKQSGRGRVPVVLPPMDFNRALEDMETYELAILSHGEGDTSINMIPGQRGHYAEIAIMIGPEGGFSCDEVRKAKEKGIPVVVVGPRTLRTETAGMVITAILMYRFGDLGGKG